MTAIPLFQALPDAATLRATSEAMLAAATRELTGGVETPPDPRILATARFVAGFASARVVSFDVFDTLIVRKVAAPRDVFLHLASAQPFAAWGLAHEALAVERIEAERTARLRGHAARGSTEVTLHEIHAALAERLGRPASDVAAMVGAERLVERALCVAHPYLRRWFERARADGKRLWVVSDTYHEAAFIEELLRGCGFDMDGVVLAVSSEARASKGEGRLFQQLLAAHDVRPDEVLHVGDHPTSDDARPRALGCATVLHPWAGSRHDDAPVSLPGDALALGLAQIGARTPEPAFPFWWRFGYSVAGPLLAGFALWLHDRFRADGIERAYFLLRDGEIIEQVYRAIVGGRPGPTTALLESSRRAYLVPAIVSGDRRLTAQLAASENPRPVREFLERFGVDARPYQLAFRQAGFASLDEVVPPGDAAAIGRALSLFSRPDIGGALRERSAMERELLVRFLRDRGVFADGRTAFVDIGWNATIQRSTQRVAETSGIAWSGTGYYLGTLKGAQEGMPDGSVHGYLFHDGTPGARASGVLALAPLVEFICTTAHGSLKGFRSEGGAVVPVHGDPDHDPAQQAWHGQLRAGVLAYARSLRDEGLVFGFGAVSPEAAARRLLRVVASPTPEEAEAIGELRHGEGIGTGRARALAAFPADAWSAPTLHEALRTAYWPAGLLARRDPRALALRTLHWLAASPTE